MNRTVRVVSLLRWTVVAMHTVLVVSTGILLANLGDSRMERMANRSLQLFLIVPDLPVAILTSPFVSAVDSRSLSPAIREFLFSAIYVILGGLQWYLIASLLARWTCGFQKTISLTSKRFGTVLILGLLLVVGCGVIPWGGHFAQYVHPRGNGPYAMPAVAFSRDSKGLRQSAVVPTLDTPMPEEKNVIWCATFQMAWTHLKDDVIGEPVKIANAEAMVERLNKAIVAGEDLPDGSSYAAAGFTKDGIAEKIRREMQERFQKEPTDLDDKGAVNCCNA